MVVEFVRFHSPDQSRSSLEQRRWAFSSSLDVCWCSLKLQAGGPVPFQRGSSFQGRVSSWGLIQSVSSGFKTTSEVFPDAAGGNNNNTHVCLELSASKKVLSLKRILFLGVQSLPLRRVCWFFVRNDPAWLQVPRLFTGASMDVGETNTPE